MDLKDFYYGNTMEEHEYTRIILSLIPQKIIYQYELVSIEYNICKYIKIQNGMPGLKQAGEIANDC